MERKESMNKNPAAKEPINAWKQKEKLPAVPVKFRVLAVIACFLCAFSVPMGGSEIFSMVALGLLFAYVVIMARVPASVALLLVPAVLTVILTAEFSVGAMVLSLVVGIACCTFLITTSKHGYLAVLIPLAAVGAAYLIHMDLPIALSALIFLPASVLLAIATRLGKWRTTAICFGIGGLLIPLVGLLLAFLWKECGSFSREAIMGYVSNFRLDLVAELMEARDELLRIAKEDTSAQAKKLYDQISESFTDAAITSAVSQLLNLLPAIVAVICSVIAFEAQYLLNLIYTTVGLKCVVTREARAFCMSVPSAVLYAVGFLLMLFLPKGSMAEAVVQNLCLILVPGLCVVGVQHLFTMAAGAKGGWRTFLIISVLALFICYPGGAFYILAMWGAYSVIAANIQRLMIEKMVRDGVAQIFDDKELSEFERNHKHLLGEDPDGEEEENDPENEEDKDDETKDR